MKQNFNFFKKALQLFCLILIQSCGPEDPTVFSGEVVDLRTGSEIPGVTLLVSVYEKSPLLTIPGIIREDTLETDSQGKFRLVVPFDERYSRFTLNVLKEVIPGIYEFADGKDCSPYDCSSLIPGKVYQFRLKIPLDSL